jgi:hypothetical protein
LKGPASQRRDVLPVEERTKARSDAGPLAAVSKRRLAECEAQFQRDLFHCKLVALKTCYAQAIVRQVACENGHSIPPLNY